MFNGISDDGKVLGVTVLDVKELPTEGSVLVLLDYMEMGEGAARNLAKFTEKAHLSGSQTFRRQMQAIATFLWTYLL